MLKSSGARARGRSGTSPGSAAPLRNPVANRDASYHRRVAWREWIRTVEIEPSLDVVATASLGSSVDVLLRTGCRIFHMHVEGDADIGRLLEVTPYLRRYGGVLDVHVRGGDPMPAFVLLPDAGADSITFDATAASDPAAAIRAAHSAGVPVGIAFGPSATPEEIATAAEGADLVLCEAGGGDIVGLVGRLSDLLPADVAIQVEGQFEHDELAALYQAGARLLIVDSPIFDREDLPRAYRRLVRALA